METGFRRTQLGELIPRDNHQALRLHLPNGTEVYRVRICIPRCPRNPLSAFTTVATESGHALVPMGRRQTAYTVTEIAPIRVE